MVAARLFKARSLLGSSSMPVTFRSGPRDPVTGRSSAVVSDPGNIVRASGQTDNERAARQASYNFYEPGQAGSPEVNQAAAERAAQRAGVARTLGITDNNPYGNMSGLSRALGAENVSYAGNMSLNQRRGIANVMIDRYLDPVNPATGRVRPGLDAGDPTRFGPVESDPSLRRSYGIASMFPGVGMLTSMFDKSDLTVPGFTDYQNEQMSLGMAADAADVVGGPVPEPLSLEQAGIVGPESAFSDQRLSEFDDLVSEVLTRSDAIIADTAPQAGPVQGPPEFIETNRFPVRTVSPTGATLEEVVGVLDYPGDIPDAIGTQLVTSEIPSPVPVPTELTFSKRTTVADPSRLMSLPPAPAQPLTAEQQFQADLASAYEDSRRRAAAERQAQSDRLGFKMDILNAQPKAFEPRAPLPPSPPPPLPPMFNEQVDLTNPAIFGLTGFRP